MKSSNDLLWQTNTPLSRPDTEVNDAQEVNKLVLIERSDSADHNLNTTTKNFMTVICLCSVDVC